MNPIYLIFGVGVAVGYLARGTCSNTSSAKPNKLENIISKESPSIPMVEMATYPISSN